MKQTITPDHADILGKIIRPLLVWYKGQDTARQLPWREEPTPYHTWLSEIMLQQTRAAAVIPYYNRFVQVFPDIAALAAAEDEVLMKLWQGLGYYSRARNLKKAAQVIQKEHGGQLPQDRKMLMTLPGIGRYTSSAIASIAFGQPLPAVDGNVLRVVARVLTCRADIQAPRTRTAFEQLLAPHYPAGHDAGALNQAFMDLGATICLPNGSPHCSRCPLSHLCLAFETGTIRYFPHKSPPKARRIEKRTVFILKQEDAVALNKRPDKGLLAGLWEFPNCSGTLDLAGVKAYLAAHQMTAVRIQKLPAAKHIFSHVEWHLSGWKIQLAPNHHALAETQTAFTWATPDILTQNYSIPAAFGHYVSHIK